MVVYKVTKHAISRFRERTGSKKTDEQIKNTILKLSQQGVEVTPTGKSAVLQLINNGFKDFKYYNNGGFIFVVDKDTVVTTFKKEKRRWRQ